MLVTLSFTVTSGILQCNRTRLCVNVFGIVSACIWQCNIITILYIRCECSVARLLYCHVKCCNISLLSNGCPELKYGICFRDYWYQENVMTIVFNYILCDIGKSDLKMVRRVDKVVSIHLFCLCFVWTMISIALIILDERLRSGCARISHVLALNIVFKLGPLSNHTGSRCMSYTTCTTVAVREWRSRPN